MKTIFLMWLLLFCVTFASANTRLTQAQAVQRAVDFCQHLGSPVTGEGIAHLHIRDDLPPSDYKYRYDNYYQPYWEVTFEDQTEVQVVDATGIISGYSHVTPANLVGTQPGDNDISKEEALQIAINALQATNQTDMLHFDEASRNAEPDPPGGHTDHNWHFDWNRTINGILFHDQGVRITVQPTTGLVLGVWLEYPTPLPQSVDVTVTRAQADAIASALVSNQPKIQDATLYDIKIRIVQPNDEWLPGTKQQMAGMAHVAYVYTLSDPLNTITEIWVDAQTGRVLGGDYAIEFSDEKTPPKLPLRKRLMQAQEVRIYARQRNGKLSEHPITVLNARSQGKMFALLKAAKSVKKPGPLAIAEYRVVLYAKGKPICALNYMPATGRIGTDYSWGVVPERFKTWMHTLNPHAHPAKPTKLAWLQKLRKKP